MNCPAILTGDQFLTRVLGHIDCQAAFLGSYGWQALGQPGSLAATVMTGLLTLFVALFGIRLLFGPAPGARDLVGDVIKIGIVLTLAFSWPAFRTLVHDVVLDGPGELAASAGAPILSQEADLMQRLQQADNLMLRLVEQGTGRQTGAYVDADDPGGTFRGQALEDENSFGLARLFYLAGLLGSYGLLRIVAGLLLALAPLAAGMLLFEATRGLFAGLLRALVLVLIGAAAVSVVTAAQIAILLPWLTDALRLRALGYATPAAPTELLALTLGFALIQFGTIWLMAKVAFNRGWISLPALPDLSAQGAPSSATTRSELAPAFVQSRSQRLVDHMETQLRREEHFASERTDHRLLTRGGDTAAPAGAVSTGGRMSEPLGSSWRRTTQRRSSAATRRDRGS
jgi:type IV secretion system protein VirB6